jgi:16S rRNA processing protein RimM
MLPPMSLIEIGILGRPHGVHGELSLYNCPLTPLELHELKTFTARGTDGKSRALTLATARPANDKVIVRFAGVENRDAAAALTRGRLMVERERLPDPGENLAYTFQLIGLDVVTDEGRTVGQVAEVWPTPANTVLVVRGGAAGEVLIPAIEPFVTSVDLAARRITVRLLPGMESEEPPPSSE